MHACMHASSSAPRTFLALLARAADGAAAVADAAVVGAGVGLAAGLAGGFLSYDEITHNYDQVASKNRMIGAPLACITTSDTSEPR
jgi:hypothetical protein